MKLVIKHLTKKYKNKIALNNVSVTMTNGIYALLGPNGAGKTTLLHAITGLIAYDKGVIECYDENDHRIRSIYEVLGYLPQYPSFYKNFTIMEILEYIAVLKGLDKHVAKNRIIEVLKAVNLLNEQDKQVKALSGGMKQRLGIAQAMLNNPKLLIVDEPTAGLDPKERIHFRNIIKNLSKDSIVIFATHIVSDIELIATDIILLGNGHILLNEKRNTVLRCIENKVWEIETTGDSADLLTKTHRILEAYWIDNLVHLRILSDTQPLEGAVNVKPRLEDLYMHHFGDML